MRTVVLPQRSRSTGELHLSSGTGAPLFQHGLHTRIYRAPVKAIGSLRGADGAEIWGQVMDISLGGCLFKGDRTLPVGEEVELRITIVGPARRAVAEVSGIVRRTATVEGQPAMGIELTAQDSESRRSLQWLYNQALR